MTEPANALARYSSRKFTLSVLVLVIGTGAAYLDLLTPALVELLKWTLGLYLGFNVTQKASEMLASKVEAQ